MKATWHDRKSGKRQTFVAGKADGAKALSRIQATDANAANAPHARAGREPVSLTLTLTLTLALGCADLHSETTVRVTGYKDEIDAVRWLIAEVTHSMTDRGFTTGLKLESASNRQ